MTGTGTASAGSSVDPVAGPQWYYLADLKPVTENCRFCSTSQKVSLPVNGTTFPSSVAVRLDTTPGKLTWQWNASRHCTTFEATIGMKDTSADNTIVFGYALDGAAEQKVATLSAGQAQRMTIDLSGVFRYQLTAANLNTKATDSPTAVWGDARVFCTDAPG